MPGFNEFFIGNDAPMVTRIGVKPNFRVNKVVLGARTDGSLVPASQPVADVSFATILGLGQKCIGIQWGGGTFVFAGGEQVDPADPEPGVFPQNFFYAATAQHAEGKKEDWKSTVHDRGVGDWGSGCNACTAGKKLAFVGGLRVDNYFTDARPGASQGALATPVIYVSENGGAFNDSGLPRLNPVLKVVTEDDPTGDVLVGQVRLLGYNKDLDTFYASVLYQDIFVDPEFRYHHFSWPRRGGGWGEIGSESSNSESDISFAAIPEGTAVCCLFSRDHFKYCSVVSNGQSMKDEKNSISLSGDQLLINGTVDMPDGDFADAATIGNNTVVVAIGFNDDTATQPLVYAKNLNDGSGWTPVISEMSFAGSDLIHHTGATVAFG